MDEFITPSTGLSQDEWRLVRLFRCVNQEARQQTLVELAKSLLMPIIMESLKDQKDNIVQLSKDELDEELNERLGDLRPCDSEPFDLLNEDFDVTEHGWRDSGVDIAEAILGTSEDDEELADQLVRAYLEGAHKHVIPLSIDFAEPGEESQAEEEMLRHLHSQALTLIKDWRERIMQRLALYPKAN